MSRLYLDAVEYDERTVRLKTIDMDKMRAEAQTIIEDIKQTATQPVTKERHMTLLEAHNSGKKYRKIGSTGGYSKLTAFAVADLTAEYELEPVRDLVVTEAQLAAAWDTAREGRASLGAAATSPMFERFVRVLKG